jgi:hypothetical protein
MNDMGSEILSQIFLPVEMPDGIRQSRIASGISTQHLSRSAWLSNICIVMSGKGDTLTESIIYVKNIIAFLRVAVVRQLNNLW